MEHASREKKCMEGTCGEAIKKQASRETQTLVGDNIKMEYEQTEMG
jgi:hypothetical protein